MLHYVTLMLHYVTHLHNITYDIIAKTETMIISNICTSYISDGSNMIAYSTMSEIAMMIFTSNFVCSPYTL
jgi:hypothetical protein